MRKIFKNKKNISVSLFLLNLFLVNAVSAQWDPDSLTVFNMPAGTIYGIISNILSWILAVFFLVGLIGFIISGLMYLTSSGDDTRMGQAKKAMTYSIIGVIVGLSGFVIMQAITLMLGGTTYIF